MVSEPRRIDRSRLQYIPTLDGWRSIAIGLVVLGHSWVWLGYGTTRLGRLLHYPGIGAQIDRLGLLGVEIFFCLSGFLITSGLIKEGLPIRHFYVRRAFRILPAALLYLAAVSLLALLGVIAAGRKEIVASLFFFRNYLDQNAWFTGHFWSLSIEEQFYLAWPTILLLARIKGGRILAAAGVLFVIVWRQTHWPISDHSFFHTGMRLDPILCGSFMALSWPAIESRVRRLPQIVFVMAAVGFWVVNAFLNQLQGTADFIQALCACLLIAATTAWPHRLAGRILELPLMSLIGRMSYSIYLWQQIFLRPANMPHWQFPLRIAGIFLFAWLSYTFVERPLIALGRRLLSRDAPKSPRPPAGADKNSPPLFATGEGG